MENENYSGLDTSSSGEEELVFNTIGTSIDEAFGMDDDVDECEEDDYSEDKYEE